MRVVILGCGRLGSQVANALDRQGHEVSVIDVDPDAFRRLGAGFSGVKITGLGFDRETLLKSGIERADAFVAVARGDNHNIVSALVARNVFRVPRVVARIYDPERARLYWSMGILTIAPVNWGANQILAYLSYVQAREIMTLGQAEVRLYEVECPPKLVGRSVGELEVAQEVKVVSVIRRGRASLATSGMVLEQGDFLFVAVKSDYVERFEEMIRG